MNPEIAKAIEIIKELTERTNKETAALREMLEQTNAEIAVLKQLVETLQQIER